MLLVPVALMLSAFSFASLPGYLRLPKGMELRNRGRDEVVHYREEGIDGLKRVDRARLVCHPPQAHDKVALEC